MRKLLFVLLLTLTLSVPAAAGDCEGAHQVLIRDTSSAHATHDRLRPLTSTYLDTASTRLVDARRGYRPYHTVYRDGRCVHPRPVRRSIGILRPDRADRPCRPTTPRTGVSVYGSNAERENKSANTTPQRPMVVVVRDVRGEDVEGEEAEAVVMGVTIYEGEPEMPENHGAVIVRRDGTVISVGD